MKDCSINLKECETYCNEAQIYPAMKYFIKELKMSVRAASREIRKLTKNKVTATRAHMVYVNRTPVSYDTEEQPEAKETEENQGINTESDSVETTCTDYGDVKNPETETEPNKAEKKPKKKGDTNTNTKINKEQIFTESFQKAHTALFEEIQRAKMDGWKNVSKEAVYYHIDLLTSLTEV